MSHADATESAEESVDMDINSGNWEVVADRVVVTHNAQVETPPAAVESVNPVPAIQAAQPSRSPEEISRDYAKLDTSLLIELPKLPRSRDHDVVDLVPFRVALTDATNAMRVIVEGTDPVSWHPGWAQCVHEHLLEAMRSHEPSSQAAQAASDLRTQIGDIIAEVIRMQEAGSSGPEAFDHVLRMMSRALIKVTPAGVMGLLVNFTVGPGTTLAAHLARLRLLVANVQSVGRELTPGNGSIQSAIQNGIDKLNGHHYTTGARQPVLYLEAL